MQKGFLINCVQDTTLRFVPPLIVGRQEIDLLAETLDRVVDA
jgi:acetylornithine/succinyldiaminopimelate/putrescine aminotransferase